MPLCLQDTVVNEERMKALGDFSWVGQCSDFACHISVGWVTERTLFWLVRNPCCLSLKVLFWNKWRKRRTKNLQTQVCLENGR